MLTVALALAVVEQDPAMRAALAAELGRVVNVAANASIDELLDDIDVSDPAVVVFGPSFAAADGFSELASFTDRRPETTVILAVEVLHPDLVRDAVSAGVAEVITLDQVVDLVDRAATPDAPALAPPEALDDEPPEQGAQVVTVMSPKGGAGKSVVATNLAVVLAQQSDRPVCLLDCDLQFGDAAVMLMLAVNYTVADAADSMDRLDLPRLRALLTEHEPSKLLVLPAPTEPVLAERIVTADVLKLVALLRELCSYVVIDTASQLNDMMLSLLEESDQIVLVTSLDLPSIKNSKLGMQTLRLFGIPDDRMKLVLNRVNSAVPLNAERVEHVLDLPAQALIPSDIAVVQSVNKGQPVVLAAPKSPAAKALVRFAALVAKPTSAKPGRR